MPHKPACRETAQTLRGRAHARLAASSRQGGASISSDTSPQAKLGELTARLREINDLGAAGSVLSWDQATYMPAGGAEARARQGALLGRLAHEKATDPALGALLDELQPYARSLPSESDAASLIRVAARDFERAVKVPTDFVARWREHTSASYDAWTRARPADDFATMQPLLERSLDFSRQYADFFAPYAHIADPLIEDADEGMTAAKVLALFAELRAALVPLVRAIADAPATNARCLSGSFPEAAQMAFGLAVVERVGYDFQRGRVDKTHHPFCTKFAAGDVRITTRVREDDIGEALFSTLHEAGHAMYEQGVEVALEGTPLNSGASAGVHESQSRLWENVVGRSRQFWEYFYPLLCEAFPGQFANVPLDAFYRAINKVERSLIRTDADEVTYNLHVMMRFDFELALLEGRLKVKDLPEAWRARYEADLGVAPGNDREGCLQDVHWYAGTVGGGFQGYTIGNILGAQFYAAALRAHPHIPTEMAHGNFTALHSWLRQHLYRHGRKFTADELIERATGGPMSIAPYVTYLRNKYGALYGLGELTFS
ncbi:MAG TPA: carboxypeptidase M32 [Hyphomicrobiaceae bacterium]|nr:carboxypeptidase M32 [Hyphomicrobiaceae bacterium]